MKQKDKKVVCTIIFACLASIFHRFYLSYIFENEYRFPVLTTLQRELTFKSESAFYYSFYKKLLITNPNGSWISEWKEKVDEMKKDGCIQHPEVINDLKRFNLFPELLCSFLYNCITNTLHSLHLPSKYCSKIHAGNSTVESCEGIGDPLYFYIECVFTWNGLMTGMFIVTYVYVSGSLLGGFFAFIFFISNHADATRVGLLPALRESFSFPFWLAHIFVTIVIMRNRGQSSYLWAVYTITSICMLTSWQLSTFTLFISINITFFLFLFRFIPWSIVFNAVCANLLAIILSSYLTSFNTYVITSLFSSSCVCLLMILYLIKNLNRNTIMNITILLLFWLATMVTKKYVIRGLMKMEDDSHVFDIFWSKIAHITRQLSIIYPKFGTTFFSSSPPSFHTLLYICAPEFDFIDVSTYKELSKTGVLPASILVSIYFISLFFIRSFWSKRFSEYTSFSLNETSVALYLVLSTLSYLLLASLLMRLKLFLVPLLCLLACYLSHRKLPLLKNQPLLRSSTLFLAAVLLCRQGLTNVSMESSYRGMVADDSMQSLIAWIHNNTVQDAVFAGSMASMPRIHLCTNRCITNHPHYENSQLRDKTKFVYTIYSRKSEKEIWSNLNRIGANYVLVEMAWCFGTSKDGCSFDEIWKSEDQFSEKNDRFCEKVFSDVEIPRFKVVYKTFLFRLLEVLPEK